MPNDSHRPDVAVFIDFENVYVSVRDKLDANPNFEMIMDRVEDFGRVVIARAYADWYRYPRVTSALYANGIEPMAYLTDVLERIVSSRTKAHELQSLLPWNWREPSRSDAALAA